MSAFQRSLLMAAITFALASCGEPERAKPAAISAHAARVGSEFDEVGKASLYPGESCASQIMFVFHSGRSTSISLAAPMRDSFVELLRQHVNADFVSVAILPQIELCEHLVRKRVRHHEARMTSCVAEVHEAALGQQENFVAVRECVLIYLRFDIGPLHAFF